MGSLACVGLVLRGYSKTPPLRSNRDSNISDAVLDPLAQSLTATGQHSAGHEERPYCTVNATVPTGALTEPDVPVTGICQMTAD